MSSKYPYHYQRFNVATAELKRATDDDNEVSDPFVYCCCFECRLKKSSRLSRKRTIHTGQEGSADASTLRHQSRQEIRRLRTSLFEFINGKHRPMSYSLMIRYLLHWQVSVYSLVWSEVLLWLGLYTAVNVVYRNLLNPTQQVAFVRLVHSVAVWQSNMPVTFLLGFYVSTVVDRWWRAYLEMPTMSTPALRLESAVFADRDPEKAEKAELIRLTMARYLNLAWLLYMLRISAKIKQRFRILRSLIGETNLYSARNIGWGDPSAIPSTAYPALRRIRRLSDTDASTTGRQEAFRDAMIAKPHRVELLVQDLVLLNQDPLIKENYGEIITPSEIAVYEDRASKASGVYVIEYELPLHWAAAVAEQAYRDGFVRNIEGYKAVIKVLSDWSAMLSLISKYARKNLPLVYTQVVIIAVYAWFFIEVVASQNLIEANVANLTAGSESSTLLQGYPLKSVQQEQQTDQQQMANLAAPSLRYWTDFYVPVFAVLKLFFVLGWFKVAFLLMNPYADTLDGLPFNDVLNSNLRRGRVMASFPSRLLPKKLQRSRKKVTATRGASTMTDSCYLSSDEELKQELRDSRAGPWRLGCRNNGAGDDGLGDQTELCSRCFEASEGLLVQEGDLP